MNNATLQIKIKQRLNKLASNDYDNIQCWQIVEAFNKGQSDWCRRNLHGSNTKQEGDEQSTSRVDDLQILLITIPLLITDKQTYYMFCTSQCGFVRIILLLTSYSLLVLYKGYICANITVDGIIDFCVRENVCAVFNIIEPHNCLVV